VYEAIRKVGSIRNPKQIKNTAIFVMTVVLPKNSIRVRWSGEIRVSRFRSFAAWMPKVRVQIRRPERQQARALCRRGWR